MVDLVVTTSTGETRTVETRAGFSVMEVIREAGFEELQALCGGCCSCATCHVYVDDAWRDRMPKMRDDEDDLLGLLDNRLPGSRLSCQLPLTPALDGLRVTIAVED